MYLSTVHRVTCAIQALLGATLGAMVGGPVGAAVGFVAVGAVTDKILCKYGNEAQDKLHCLIDGVKKTRVIARNGSDVGLFREVRCASTDGGIPLTTRLHYFEGGIKFKGKKPSLFLVHGFGSNAYQWSQVFDELSERYHVIAIDLPGHGYSGGLTDHNYHLTDRLKPVLDQFMADLGLTDVVLVGSSLGGGISQIVARDNPRVRDLILFGTTGATHRPHRMPFFIQMAKKPLPTPAWANRLTTQWVLRTWVHPDPYAFTEHDVLQFALPYEGVEGWDKIVARAAYAKILLRYTDDLRFIETDIANQGAIQQPALLVHSLADPTIQFESGAQVADQIRKAVLLAVSREEVESAGHTLMSDTPRVALRIMFDYLAGDSTLRGPNKRLDLRRKSGAPGEFEYAKA